MTKEIAEEFGKYRLVKQLASGGMAEVFLATAHGEAGFSKQVVIKRLRPELSEDDDFTKMLVDEARITSRLTHSNICQVMDLGSVDGSYYLAMEFIAGEDLTTILDILRERGEPIPVDGALHILSEVLDGLGYAHRKADRHGQSLGIIHRDISPQNVLISYEGEVKIIDFGIAKARQRMVKTEVGVIKGKFRYMSPEQASGGQLDHRSDIFSTGVLLYELLRGESYAEDSDAHVVLQMRKAGFGLDEISQYRPDIPPELGSIIKKALDPEPDRRQDTAEQFRTGLQDILLKRGSTYGSADLAAMMRSLFDQTHRRRRSGIAPRAAAVPPVNTSAATVCANPAPRAAGPAVVATARGEGEPEETLTEPTVMARPPSRREEPQGLDQLETREEDMSLILAQSMAGYGEEEMTFSNESDAFDLEDEPEEEEDEETSPDHDPVHTAAQFGRSAELAIPEGGVREATQMIQSDSGSFHDSATDVMDVESVDKYRSFHDKKDEDPDEP